MRPAAVLTDLDGTLLDHGGELGVDARRAIEGLRQLGVPVVPLTSKTEAELRSLLDELDSGGIGSFENGAGIVGPARVEVSTKAVAASSLAERLDELAKRASLRLDALSTLSTKELRRITGLPEARLPAMLARGWSLPFLAPEGADEALSAALRGMPGLRLTQGGIFRHLSGDHGKEDALELLLRSGLVSRPVVGFGDAPNDAAFLARCDVAVLVPGRAGTVDPALAATLPAGRVAPHAAGRGWAAALGELVGEAA